MKVTITQPSHSVNTDTEASAEVTILLKTLLKGDPGDPGTAASVFVYTQPTPASVWTVPHNLHKKPSVTVTDTFDNVLVCDVAYVDSDIIQITHGVAMIGNVYCN